MAAGGAQFAGRGRALARDGGGQLRVELAVDPGDGAAGDRVVELDEDGPQPIGGGQRLTAGDHPHRLVGQQRLLGPPVLELELALGGVGGAVVLEVHLPLVDRQPVGHRAQAVEEVLGPGPLGLGYAGEVLEAPRPLEHFLGRAAEAVGGEQLVVDIGLLVFVHRICEFAAQHLAVVAAGREVGDQFGAVGTAPAQAGVGEPGHRRPDHLGGVEVVAAAELGDLGQAVGVAEDVGDPEHAADLAAAQLGEALLAVEEAAGQGLARGDGDVGLDLHPAGGLPAPGGDLLLDLRVEGRRVLAQVVVEGDLGRDVAELGAALHVMATICSGQDANASVTHVAFTDTTKKHCRRSGDGSRWGSRRRCGGSDARSRGGR